MYRANELQQAAQLLAEKYAVQKIRREDIEFLVTPRDGMQSRRVHLEQSNVAELTQLYLDAGMDMVELNWPSNPENQQLYKDLWQNHEPSKVVPFCSTARAEKETESTVSQIDPKTDKLISGAYLLNPKAVVMFGKAHIKQVKTINLNPEQNLDLIAKSVFAFVENGSRVIFDLEHGMTGLVHDFEYTCSCARAAISAGADTVVVCDTTGYMDPEVVYEVLYRFCNEMAQYYPGKAIKIGFHGHNDHAMGVAATVRAVLAGCRHIQGSFGVDIGERVGNVDLLGVIANLMLTTDMLDPLPEAQKWPEVYRRSCELLGIQANESHPFVSENAQRTEAGAHIAALKRDPYSYVMYDSEALFGIKPSFGISKRMGRAGLAALLEEYEMDREVLKKLSDDRVTEVLAALEYHDKEKRQELLEHRANCYLLLQNLLFGGYKLHFWMLEEDPHIPKLHIDWSGECSFEACLALNPGCISTDKQKELHRATIELKTMKYKSKKGLYAAIEESFFDALEIKGELQMCDNGYNVVTVTNQGAASRVRVSMQYKYDGGIISACGVHSSQQKACILAMINILNYYFLKGV